MDPVVSKPPIASSAAPSGPGCPVNQGPLPALEDTAAKFDAMEPDDSAHRAARALNDTRSALAKGLVKPDAVRSTVARMAAERAKLDAQSAAEDAALERTRRRPALTPEFVSEQLDLYRRGINDRDPRTELVDSDYVILGNKDFDTETIVRDAASAGLISAWDVEAARLEGLDHKARLVIDALRSGQEPASEGVTRGLATGLFTQADVDAARATGVAVRGQAALRSVKQGAIDPSLRDPLERAIKQGVFCVSDVQSALPAGHVRGDYNAARTALARGADPDDPAIVKALNDGRAAGLVSEAWMIQYRADARALREKRAALPGPAVLDELGAAIRDGDLAPDQARALTGSN